MKAHHTRSTPMIHLIAAVLVACLTVACSGETAPADATTDGTTAAADSGSTGDVATNQDGSTAVDAGTAAPEPPQPFKYSGGTCPKLNSGSNKLFSWDGDRLVDLYVPSGTEKPGILFAWHGLGDSKGNFGKAIGAAAIASKLNVIVVVAQSKGSVTGWGWTSDNTALRDSTLFDDLLNCVSGQWQIDSRRVYTMGFSAGALWSSYLVVKRSTFLAAALIWSGGTGPKAYTYKKPKRKIPVLLAWGGAEDNAFLSFDATTKHMATNLRKDGHVVVTCNHGQKHTIPFNGLNWGLSFLNAHKWESLQNSPYATSDLAEFPKYCTNK